MQQWMQATVILSLEKSDFQQKKKNTIYAPTEIKCGYITQSLWKCSMQLLNMQRIVS